MFNLFDLWTYFLYLFRAIPIIFLQILFLFGIYIFCIKFLLNLNFSKKKYIFLIFYISLSGLLLICSEYFNKFSLGIVNQDILEIYIGPDKNYPVKSNLKLMDKVFILENSGQFLFVYGDNKKGWVDRNGIIRCL